MRNDKSSKLMKLADIAYPSCGDLIRVLGGSPKHKFVASAQKFLKQVAAELPASLKPVGKTKLISVCAGGPAVAASVSLYAQDADGTVVWVQVCTLDGERPVILWRIGKGRYATHSQNNWVEDPGVSAAALAGTLTSVLSRRTSA